MTTVTDERDLWVRYKDQGDESARDDLIVSYMRVVKYVAGRMAMHVPPNVEMDDLVGWGVLGLMDAIRKFDPSQNIKFSTYATIRIRGAILNEIRSLDQAPCSLRAMARRVGSAREKLRHEKGNEPNSQEIADEIGIGVEQVDECLAQLQAARVLSLDDYLSSDEREEARELDLIEDTSLKTPESEAVEQERQAHLVQAILPLPDQQQKVLNLYYYEELTLKEIGAVL